VVVVEAEKVIYDENLGRQGRDPRPERRERKERRKRGVQLRYIILCDDELPFYFIGQNPRREILFLCEDVSLQKRLTRRGAKCRCGQLRKAAIYQRMKMCPTDRIGLFIQNS